MLLVLSMLALPLFHPGDREGEGNNDTDKDNKHDNNKLHMHTFLIPVAFFFDYAYPFLLNELIVSFSGGCSTERSCMSPSSMTETTLLSARHVKDPFGWTTFSGRSSLRKKQRRVRTRHWRPERKVEARWELILVFATGAEAWSTQ